jgi:hypothetical protein
MVLDSYKALRSATLRLADEVDALKLDAGRGQKRRERLTPVDPRGRSWPDP